jgi:hypothetical protein
MMEAFSFPSFLVEGPTLELATAAPDESVSGTGAEIDTTGIGDSGASSKSET